MKDFHEKWRNKLGNLTLLSDQLNKEAQQDMLVDKIPVYDQDVFRITKEIGTKWSSNNDWTEKEINKRKIRSLFKNKLE